MATGRATGASWRTLVKVFVGRDPKGAYVATTAVEVEWSGAAPDQAAGGRLQTLLAMADQLARDEIAERRLLDSQELTADDGPIAPVVEAAA